MKIKNLLLGIAALLFAVVSAFASYLAPVAGQRADVAGTCEDIQDVNCGTPGDNDCEVFIDGVAGGPYKVHPDGDCDAVIKTTLDEPLTTELE